MAPIVSAVRSALLHAEPSHDTQATSSAATLPSLLIGITLLIIGIVVAIGTVCWLLRKKRAAKRLGEETPSRTETTFAGAEVKYQRISGPYVSKAELSEHSKSPESTSCIAITSESRTAAGSHSSKEEERDTPQQLFSYYQRSPLELSGVFE